MHSRMKPRATGVSMVASAAWPRTCESWSGGPVRPPLADATPQQGEQLRTDLVAGGLKLAEGAA